MDDFSKSLINNIIIDLKENKADYLCMGREGCYYFDCETCPYNSELNKQKTIEALEEAING